MRSEMTVSLGLYEKTMRVHRIVEPQYLLLRRTKPHYIITERTVPWNKRTQPIDALCGLFMGSEVCKLMSGVEGGGDSSHLLNREQQVIWLKDGIVF